MSLRPSTKETTDKIKELRQQDDDDDVQTQKKPTLSQRALAQALTSTGNLANLLPTGTVLAFQLLTPIFTNNGSCDHIITGLLTQLLLLFLAASCFIASFTDSLRSSEGKVYHGFATFKGIWFFDCYPTTSSSNLPDLTKYKLRFIDVVHAVLSVLVFISVALRDKNVVHCFYPEPQFGTQQVLNIVPLGIGLISSLLFVVFPTRRRGIGYPIGPKS